MNHIELGSPMKAPATLPSLLEQLEQQAPEQTRSAEEVAPHVKANRIADPTFPEIVPPGTEAADLELGQPVFHSTFGYGEVAAIDGNDITIREKKDHAVTHTVKALDLLTKIQAEVGLKACYFAGGAKAWRRAQGRWASLTKNLCKQGEWGEVLEKYDLNRSSMDDLIRRFEEEATWEAQDLNLPESGKTDETNPAPKTATSVYSVTGGRQVNERTPDPENANRQKNIKIEIAKRGGIKPTHHKTTLYLQRRHLDANKLGLYHEIEKADKRLVNAIMHGKIDQGIEEVLALASSVLPQQPQVSHVPTESEPAILANESTSANITPEDAQIEADVRSGLRGAGIKQSAIKRIRFIRGLDFDAQYHQALKQLKSNGNAGHQEKGGEHELSSVDSR